MHHIDTGAVDVDLHEFHARVIGASHRLPVLVDFWADWCGPCHALSPVLARVLHEYAGRVCLAKCEVDEGENMKLAGHYGLRGFPTVLLFVNGSEVGRFTSARPAQFIRDFLDHHLPRT